jgi:hypothetical protein
MGSRSLRRLVLVAAVGLMLHTWPARADDIDQLYEQGQTAFEQQRYEEARAKLSAVWASRQSYDVAAVLAQAELQVGKHRDAAEHLAYAVAHFPVSAKIELRKHVEAMFAEAKKHVATVRVTVNLDGADVRVDGVTVGRAPLAGEIFLDPGARKIEARFPQHVTATRKIEVRKGAAEKVELVLVAESAKAATPRSMVPAFVMGGAAVAALGVGIGLTASAFDGDARSKGLGEQIRGGGGTCVSGAPNYDPRCDDFISGARANDAMSRAGVGLYIGAGALLTGALVYWFWPARSSVRPQVAVLPNATGVAGSMQISGQF